MAYTWELDCLDDSGFVWVVDGDAAVEECPDVEEALVEVEVGILWV